MIINEQQWPVMKSIVSQWNSINLMKLDEKQWNDLKINEKQLASLTSNRNQWPANTKSMKSVEIKEHSWSTMKINWNKWRSVETNEHQLKSLKHLKSMEHDLNSMKISWSQWNLLKLQTIEQGNRLHNGSTSSLQQIRIACREDLAQCTHGVADTTQLELRKPLQLRGVAGEEVHNGRGSAPLMSRQLAILKDDIEWGGCLRMVFQDRWHEARWKSIEIDGNR